MFDTILDGTSVDLNITFSNLFWKDLSGIVDAPLKMFIS